VIKRYNVVILGGRAYVNDPDTMSTAPFPTVRGAEQASRQLNRGELARDDLQWIGLD
jgi:hypothetical protein